MTHVELFYSLFFFRPPRPFLRPEGVGDLRGGSLHRPRPALLWGTRLHGLQQPPPAVGARHGSLYLRGGKHSHVAAGGFISFSLMCTQKILLKVARHLAKTTPPTSSLNTDWNRRNQFGPLFQQVANGKLAHAQDKLKREEHIGKGTKQMACDNIFFALNANCSYEPQARAAGPRMRYRRWRGTPPQRRWCRRRRRTSRRSWSSIKISFSEKVFLRKHANLRYFLPESSSDA